MKTLDKPLVSIIIPIYNVEPYLERCVSSVQTQTYQNLEIILVNDGSTDNSPIICNELAAADKRIVVIHQENMGQWAARNAGLEVFKGEWGCFVDSDDWVETTYVETLLSAATDNNCLMATCKLKVIFPDTAVVNSASLVDANVSLFNWRNFLMYINGNQHGVQFSLSTPCHGPWPMWLSIYSRKILKAFRFTNYRCGEDAAYTHLPIYACQTKGSLIAVSNLPLYNYFQRPESTSRPSKINIYFFDLIDAFLVALDFYEQKNELELYDIYWNIYYGRCINIACECTKDIPQYKDEIETIINYIKQGLPKAYALSHPGLRVPIYAKHNWEQIVNGDSKYIIYGYGKHGRRIVSWLKFLGVPIVEIWDRNAEEGTNIEGIPFTKMHNGFVGQNVQIICTIYDKAVYYPVFYELRQIGYKRILSYDFINDALKYGKYKKILPFLLEEL